MILWTRHDGRVSVTHPSETCLRWMSTGGRWADQPRGFVEVQIDRQIANGINPDVAAKFARAMAFGGLTRAEGLALIRDRDCRDGTAHDWITADDLPDRWFRDAWRRSHNGGPIRLDLDACRRQQWRHIKLAVPADDFEPVVIDWDHVRHALKRAADHEAVRRVWPKELERPDGWSP